MYQTSDWMYEPRAGSWRVRTEAWLRLFEERGLYRNTETHPRCRHLAQGVRLLTYWYLNMLNPSAAVWCSNERSQVVSESPHTKPQTGDLTHRLKRLIGVIYVLLMPLFVFIIFMLFPLSGMSFMAKNINDPSQFRWVFNWLHWHKSVSGKENIYSD